MSYYFITGFIRFYDISLIFILVGSPCSLILFIYILSYFFIPSFYFVIPLYFPFNFQFEQSLKKFDEEYFYEKRNIFN